MCKKKSVSNPEAGDDKTVTRCVDGVSHSSKITLSSPDDLSVRRSESEFSVIAGTWSTVELREASTRATNFYVSEYDEAINEAFEISENVFQFSVFGNHSACCVASLGGRL